MISAYVMAFGRQDIIKVIIDTTDIMVIMVIMVIILLMVLTFLLVCDRQEKR